jgi:hypothetical protein
LRARRLPPSDRVRPQLVAGALDGEIGQELEDRRDALDDLADAGSLEAEKPAQHIVRGAEPQPDQGHEQ